MILDDWQRIEKVVDWAGLSVNSFARSIGLNRAENLYQIKRGNNGISKDLVELIVAKYPEISRAWILAGEGEMFVGQSGGRLAIPCFDVDAVHLASSGQFPQPSYVISVPRFRDASFAALCMDRAMDPEIPYGALGVFAETSLDRVIPGYAYLVVSDRLAALRNLRMEPGGDTIRLKAANAGFDDMGIHVREVKKIYAFKGYVNYNQ